MGREGFGAHLFDKSLIALPLILLLRHGFTNKFSNPAFSLLISLMGLYLKIWIVPFSEKYLLIMG
jgi:hypothetical protein